MNGQEQPLVSVIVPVYNAGMYVKRCVESIFNQKHSNVQVILVNDASTDDSDKICSELSKNDGRIIYLCHDVNKGQTVTRNDGVASATGEWMMFVDADDTIDADAISSMIEFANDSNVDIVFAGYKMILKNGVKIYTANIKEGVYSRNDFVKYIFDAVPSNVITCIGSKLYRMSFIKDRKEVTSDEVKTNYDMAFIIDALISCRKVAYKDKAIYNYIQRSGSITYSYRNDMYRQISVARSKIPLLLKLSGHYEDKCFDYYQLVLGLTSGSLYQEVRYRKGYTHFKECLETIYTSPEFNEICAWREKNRLSFLNRLLIRNIENKKNRVLYVYYKFKVVYRKLRYGILFRTPA